MNRIDKKLKDIPVVITSVLNEESMANSLGADDYIGKPFEPKELLLRIKNIINKSNKLDLKSKYLIGSAEIDLNKMNINFNNKIKKINNSEKKVLIQGPNTLAAFLDTIRIGHHYLQLNETAEKVAEVVRKIKIQFDSFDKSTEAVTKRLEASIKEVSSLQTRINVLGRELNKGAADLKDN